MGQRRVRRGIAVALALGLGAWSFVPLGAQTPTAAVTGVVRDTSGRIVVGVEVHAQNPATGFSYRAVTGASGRYWLGGLPPGHYDVTARRLGLRAATVTDVELAVGHSITIDFTLRPAAVALEPVTVAADELTTETTRSEVAFLLDHERIERLPEESRNFIELARLVPGATAGADGLGGLPSFGTRGSAVGALNQQSLGVLVDGGDLTDPLFGDLGGSLPLLAVQEFEVVQSQYSAELGRAASGVVNVVTRRGGNALQVEGFGLYRDRLLNARGVFEAEKPDFNRSHWGIAVGGPIAVDRTHFFTAFERRVQHDFSTVNTGGAFPSYEGTFKTPFIDNLMFARVDHQASETNELSLRYAGEIGEQLSGVGGIKAFEHGINNHLAMHSGLLSHRWNPTAGLLNEARVHVIWMRRALERNAPEGPTLLYPSLNAGPIRQHGVLRSMRAEVRDHLSRTLSGRTGTHRLGIGAQLSWQDNREETFFFDNGLFSFARDTSSQPALAVVTYSNGAVRLDARNLQLGFYLEDAWNPIQNLTLNLGLRYDIETNGSNQGFVSPYAGQLPFIPTTPRPIDKNNLAPRIGVAWDPFGHGRTVVRGGFGIFYDASVAVPLLALERSSGVRTARIPNPGTTVIDDLMVDPDTVPPTIWTQGDIRTPMTRQLSLGVQHSFFGDITVRVDGLLVQGRNLLLQRELNPIDSLGPRYPGFASILQVVSAGRATAKMLLVEARKRFPNGWLSIGYTLADRKNTNDGWGGQAFQVPQTDPDSLNLGSEWGRAAWDERHRLVATGEIGLTAGLDLVGKAVYSSARPFTAITGHDDNQDFSTLNDRPPGEGRNARRGPDYFRTDIGITWSRTLARGARLGLTVNVYNLFNTTNEVPASVQRNITAPGFGQANAAFSKRQVEVGIQVHWG
jgi:outer membrane receptor protein involved in Fe transport